MLKPYELTMNNVGYGLFPDITSEQEYAEAHPKTAKKLGLIACFMYFQEPDFDKTVFYFEDDEKITFYDQREYTLWLGGIALNSDDERILRLAHRNQPSFDTLLGWRPRTVINWQPTQKDYDDYILFQANRADEEWEHFDDED